MHLLAERAFIHIRREELLHAGDRIGIAVSAGIDSVAMLRLLLELRDELGIVLSVVHFNHKLRGAESDADQQFVSGLAREHGLEFYCESGDVARLAANEHSGLEAAARELRYRYFGRLLGADGDSKSEIEADVPQGLKPESLVQPNGTAEAVPFQSLIPGTEAVPASEPPRKATFEDPASVHWLDKIVTGHTLDDQAETVLLRLIRGTGLRGLGGIYPRIVVERDDGESHGEIVRPLLGIRRKELEEYLKDLEQPWREDSTNAESKFTRNRIRKLVLPLLEREFNPTLAGNFAELAEIARDEEDYWESEISGWMGTVVQWSQPEGTREIPGFSFAELVQIQPSTKQLSDPKLPNPEFLERLAQSVPVPMSVSLSRPWLITEPRAVQRRVLKAIGEQAGIPLEFKHIEEILRFAAEDGPSGKELSLPLRWKLIREPEAIVFVTPDLPRQTRISNYEYLLSVPGRTLVPELGAVFEALRITLEARDAEYNAHQLLRADLLSKRLIVRNWHPGDRFWPAHTKSPKKIKELLQACHITQHVTQPAGQHFPQAQRRLWPVVASGDEIVWVRGFPVPAGFQAEPMQDAVLIRETPWEEELSI